MVGLLLYFIVIRLCQEGECRAWLSWRMLPGKQDESLKAGCVMLSIYMKSCWLYSRSLIELRVGSSDGVGRRAAAISFFSLLFLEGIAAIFVLFSQSEEHSSQFLVGFSNQVNVPIFWNLEPPVWGSWLSEVLKTLGHIPVLRSPGSSWLLSPALCTNTVITLWNLGGLEAIFLFLVFKIFSVGCLR